MDSRRFDRNEIDTNDSKGLILVFFSILVF